MTRRCRAAVYARAADRRSPIRTAAGRGVREHAGPGCAPVHDGGPPMDSLLSRKRRAFAADPIRAQIVDATTLRRASPRGSGRKVSRRQVRQLLAWARSLEVTAAVSRLHFPDDDDDPRGMNNAELGKLAAELREDARTARRAQRTTLRPPARKPRPRTARGSRRAPRSRARRPSRAASKAADSPAPASTDAPTDGAPRRDRGRADRSAP